MAAKSLRVIDLLRGAVGNNTPAGKHLTNIRKLATGGGSSGGGSSSSSSSGCSLKWTPSLGPRRAKSKLGFAGSLGSLFLLFRSSLSHLVGEEKVMTKAIPFSPPFLWAPSL
jgi:hypothetical protein